MDSCSSKDKEAEGSGHHQKLARGKERFYPESQKARDPTDTLITDCQPSEPWDQKFLSV